MAVGWKPEKWAGLVELNFHFATDTADTPRHILTTRKSLLCSWLGYRWWRWWWWRWWRRWWWRWWRRWRWWQVCKAADAAAVECKTSCTTLLRHFPSNRFIFHLTNVLWDVQLAKIFQHLNKFFLQDWKTQQLWIEMILLGNRIQEMYRLVYLGNTVFNFAESTRSEKCTFGMTWNNNVIITCAIQILGLSSCLSW